MLFFPLAKLSPRGSAGRASEAGLRDVLCLYPLLLPSLPSRGVTLENCCHFRPFRAFRRLWLFFFYLDFIWGGGVVYLFDNAQGSISF